MKDIYKNKYQDSDLNLSSNFRVYLMQQLTNSLKLNKSKILDIGCFDGTFLSGLTGNNLLFGLEASSAVITKAKSKGITIKQFFFNDNDLPYESSTFDFIIAGEIIEHIYDTDKFLSEIHRLLKPNGQLLLSTPNIASLPRRLLLLFGVNPIIETTPNLTDSSGHIRYFTRSSLHQLLKSNNFTVTTTISDLVNLHPAGKIQLKWLARLIPTFGQSIICLCQKN